MVGNAAARGNLQEHPKPMVVETDAAGGRGVRCACPTADAELGKPDETGAVDLGPREEKAPPALIYACSANAEKPVIDADAARWACDLSEHLTRRMLTSPTSGSPTACSTPAEAASCG